MSTNQPDGTPTWVDIGVPDLDRALEFYRGVFGWEFNVGPAEAGHYTMCLLRDRPVAAITGQHEESAGVWEQQTSTDVG